MAHISRVYIPGRLGPGPLTLAGEEAKRLGAVMRLRPGDPFLVFSGDGREWRATVSGAGRGTLFATVGELVRQDPVSALTLEVWCGLVRPNRFDWAIEKCVEAGADVIRPLLGEHAARGAGDSEHRRDRWERIAVEATEQCGRLHMPLVEAPAPFERLVEHHHGVLVLAHPHGMPWGEVSRLLPRDGRLAVAVGPEGGFSEAEIALARARGALVASLGPNVLRTETAAVVAVGLVRISAS